MLGECRRKILIYQYQLPILTLFILYFSKVITFNMELEVSLLLLQSRSPKTQQVQAIVCPDVTWDSNENRSGVLVSLKAWSYIS